MRITRRLEFDAGHRIPNHRPVPPPARAPYTLEVTLGGGVIDAAGRPDDGMVMDFSEVKAIASSMWSMPGTTPSWSGAATGRWIFSPACREHKTVVLDAVPTAENLARIAFAILDPLYRDNYGNHLHLERIRLYETPNLLGRCHAR